MGLLVYDLVAENTYEAYSTGGTFTNPITTVHNGRNGDVFEVKLYLGREDEDGSAYENIAINPVHSGVGRVVPGSADDDISGEGSGWGVKLMLDPGHDPTETEWDAVNYASGIPFENISGDTKAAFWYRIESPHNIDIGYKENVALELQYTEITGD